MVRQLFLILVIFFSIKNLHAANSLSYSGRLVQASGAPVTGPVNLRAELVYTNATSTVLCSQNLTSVALTKGVFHLKLDLNCTPKTMNQVLAETPNGESVAIRIIDQTNSKTYPLQAIHSVPFSKVAEQLPQMGASAGQALAWDGSKWAPTSVGTGNGTVMSVTAGTGLSGGTITTTGTIGIAAGGITSTELANNAVTATKINAGEITSSHISATANIPYSKLSILDGEIPAVKINGLQSEIDNIISSVITNGDTTHAPSGDAVHDALTLKFDKAGGALTPGSTITGLPTLPLVGSEATSKDYVDNKIGALTTTNIAEGTNYYFTEPRVLATPLTGVNVSEAGTIAASDSVLQAFGKTQKQISDITSTITGNQWAVSGSDVYRASGKVGIGTNTPQNTLDVRGTITSSSGSTWGSGANSQFKAIDSNGLLFSLGLDAGNSKLELNTQYWSMPIVFSVNNSEKMRILNNGNVGIGTAAPGEKLEVSGNIKANQLCIGADCRSAWPSVGSGSVTTTEIADGTIQTADIGNSQVSYAKLNLTDGDIPLAKLDGASDASKYLRGDKTWATFATDAINSVLSTFTVGTGTKPSVSNTDTVVGAFGKVQKSLNDINADYVSKTADQVIFGSLAINSTTGFITVPNPINPNDAANKAYVDGFGQWLENGSNIYFNTGNVGIGTNIPSQKLSVSDSMAITNSAGIQYLLIGNQDSSGVNHPSIIRAANGNLEIGTGTSWSGTGGTFNSKVYFADSGNVGIGTATPGNRLEVNSGTLGESGIKLTQLNSNSAVSSVTNKALSLNSSGEMVWSTINPSGTTTQYTPFIAINKNFDFLDLPNGSTGLPNYSGSSGAISNWDISYIDVNSGQTPATRDAEAKSLLDYMGIGQGTLHFHNSFKIMKLTRKNATPGGGYVFYIPKQHIPTGFGSSYIVYTKVVGATRFNYSENTSSWSQTVVNFSATGNPGSYTHIDYYESTTGSTGDEFYIALPVIVPGHWPTGVRHGVLPSTSGGAESSLSNVNWKDNGNSTFFNRGNVGIGTSTPTSKLHISDGEVQLGSSGSGCTAANEGAQRYNSTTKRMDFCDGVSWQSLGTPAGSISAYSQSTCPGGWLAANGALVSRTTYAALFAAISTSYGVGDGSTTFKLPDYRGYFLRGWNNGSGVDPAAASRTNRGDGTTGDVVGSVQSDDNKSHVHGVTDPGHSHAQATMDGIPGANREVPQASSYGIDYGDGAGAVPTASSVTSISIQANGGAESRPKNINVLYCIKY